MKKFLVFGILALTGCVTMPEPVVMTDQHIAGVSDAALCSLSKTNPDPRIDAEMQSRNVDCDPAALRCGAKGIKKGTQKFSECKESEKLKLASESNNTVPQKQAYKSANSAHQEQAYSCGFMDEFLGGVDCFKRANGQEIQCL